MPIIRLEPEIMFHKFLNEDNEEKELSNYHSGPKSKANQSIPVFVNIDIPREHPSFPEYKTAKPASEKIDLMVASIEKAYLEVSKAEPNAISFVITAREYAITDKDDVKSIDKKDKQDMVRKIEALVDKYPMLTVITSPTLVRKLQQPIAKAYKIRSYYSKIEPLSAVESPNEFLYSPIINQHILFNRKKLDDAIKKNQPFTELSLKSYIIAKKNSGDKKPLSRTKLAPCNEQEPYEFSFTNPPKKLQHSQPIDGVYSPGKKDKVLLQLSGGMLLDLFICRELLLIPKKELASKAKLQTSADAQLILSDSIPLLLNHLSANDVLYADGFYGVKHIVLNPAKPSRIVVYNFNMLDSEPKLTKIPPLCPLKYQYDLLIRHKQKEYEGNHHLLNQLRLLDLQIGGDIPQTIPLFEDYEILLRTIITRIDQITDITVKLLWLDIANLIFEVAANQRSLEDTRNLNKIFSSRKILETAIIEAIVDQDTDSIELIVQHGFDIHEKTDAGTSFYDQFLGSDFSTKEIIELFDKLTNKTKCIL